MCNPQTLLIDFDNRHRVHGNCPTSFLPKYPLEPFFLLFGGTGFFPKLNNTHIDFRGPQRFLIHTYTTHQIVRMSDIVLIFQAVISQFT